MQTMVFTGRLAADPQISPDFAKAVFRLLEKRGVGLDGKDRIVGVNCVSWSKASMRRSSPGPWPGAARRSSSAPSSTPPIRRGTGPSGRPRSWSSIG